MLLLLLLFRRLALNGKIILRWGYGIRDENVECIPTAEDRDQWQDLENTVKHLWGSVKCGNFVTSRATISFSRRTLLLEAN
jgi:hypothetical protein